MDKSGRRVFALLQMCKSNKLYALIFLILLNTVIFQTTVDPRNQTDPVVLRQKKGLDRVLIAVEGPVDYTALPLFKYSVSVNKISVVEIDYTINCKSSFADPVSRNSNYRIPRHPLKTAPKPTINKLDKKSDNLLSNNIVAECTSQMTRNKKYCNCVTLPSTVPNCTTIKCSLVSTRSKLKTSVGHSLRPL